jgi:hypothetical protein
VLQRPVVQGLPGAIVARLDVALVTQQMQQLREMVWERRRYPYPAQQMFVEQHAAGEQCSALELLCQVAYPRIYSVHLLACCGLHSVAVAD